ncbi:hypothetical protein GEMRC1_013383 [Eukaryota sp. GEM-RC1]
MNVQNRRLSLDSSMYSESEIDAPIKGIIHPCPLPRIPHNSPEFNVIPAQPQSDDETEQLTPTYSPHSTSFLTRFLNFQSRPGFIENDHLEDYLKRKKKLKQFLETPLRLERFISLGLLICFDVFLYFFTIVPIRLTAFVVCAFLNFISLFFNSSRQHLLSRFNSTFLLQNFSHDIYISFFFFIGVCVAFMWDVSWIYHCVRGQNLLKLYSIYQLIVIFSKLLSALGQDTLDNSLMSSRFLNSSSIKKRWALFDFVLQSLYVGLHVSVVLLELVVLNVAINSESYSIIALMIATNSAELKSAVFKKYSKIPLFQIAFSDITGRFHMISLTALLALQSVADLSEISYQVLYQIFIAFVALITAEVFVDWVKHSFICYFNDHSPLIYYKFSKILYHDILFAFNRHAAIKSTKPKSSVARRIGFLPLPLVCVAFRVFYETIASDFFSVTVLELFLIFLCLVALKFGVSWMLLRKSLAYRKINSDSELSSVQRYLLLEKRIP